MSDAPAFFSAQSICLLVFVNFGSANVWGFVEAIAISGHIDTGHRWPLPSQFEYAPIPNDIRFKTYSAPAQAPNVRLDSFNCSRFEPPQCRATSRKTQSNFF